MNINSISFKGTFELNRNEMNPKGFLKVLNKEDELCLSFEPASTQTADKKDSLFIHLPDENDVKLMKILNKVRIPFVRLLEAETLNHDNIRKRIVLNPNCLEDNPKLVEVNVSKLDTELRKHHDAYVGRNASCGSSMRYRRFKNYLKTNQEIRSTIVYLNRESNGEISTHIYDGNHRFAVMRDMGMTTVPVTIDEKSLELANQIGLIKSEL